ncbi:MAG: aspartate-semialdehyde dehydrogenase [Planctomycetes bacterium]|nr:aspartate-semialdehyde dehydrogenase [Planctomycetota bacterium]
MRICILGATGLVGRECLDLVARAWPQADLRLLASRDQALEHCGQQLRVHAATGLEAADAPRGDLALVALDDAHSARYVPRLLALGYRVVDKSNTYRADPEVVLGVAGVNHQRIGPSDRLVANPNCTTIPLALALQPLQRAFGLCSVQVSTYQAISGAGQQTLDEFLADCQRGYAAADRLGAAFAANGYAGNTVPHHARTDASGFSAEEQKLMTETRRILELPELRISAQCCRVPVAVGHYENVWVELEQPASVAAAAQALANGGPFVHWVPSADGAGLSALAAVADRDRALVGRLRLDPRDPTGHTLCLTVVGDNLRLGAATNAVRLAAHWFASADPTLQAAP